MFWNVLYSIIPILAFIATIFFYKRKGRIMNHFYDRMLSCRTQRKLFSRLILVLLLFYHFLFSCSGVNILEGMPSSFICFALFSHNLAERFFDFLKNRHMQAIYAIIMVNLLLIPHLYMLGSTLAILFFASLFYPSKCARESVRYRRDAYEIFYDIRLLNC